MKSAGRRELHAGQHAEHAGDGEEDEGRGMKRMPMTEWLTAASRCIPARWPRSRRAAGAAAVPGTLRWRVAGCTHLSPSSRGACASAAEKSSGRMDDDDETHAGVAETAELVAGPFVTARLVGLDAQEIHVPRHRIDLAGKARHPEGMDDVEAGDHDVDGVARGQVQDVPGLDPAMIGIAEGPDPLPPLGLDRCGARSRQRQQPLARDQRIGDERHQDDGRQHEAAEHDPARRRHARAPAGPPDHQREEDR